MTGTSLPPFRFGSHEFAWGRDVVELRDSSPLLTDFDALRARLSEEGYLFVRGFYPAALANRAQTHVFKAIGERGGLNPDGTISDKNQSFGFFRDLEVAHAPEILDLTDGAHTWRFFENLLGAAASTFDKNGCARWLKAATTVFTSTACMSGAARPGV